MKFYIDTANVDEIRKANDMGIIAGVTTNPSLIAKEGRDYAETLKEITSIVDGPISGEVKATTLDAAGMIEEGRAIYALDPAHMVVKIPMTAEGLKAIKVLSSEGIPTNCTLIFSANQALLAARALSDKKGKEIRVMEIAELTTLADYFVLATGASNTQINALVDNVEKLLAEEAGEQPLHREGYRGGTWVLLDYGCIAIHVFNQEARAFYGLERLWQDGKSVDISGIVEEHD